MESSDKHWFKDQVNALAVNFRQETSPALYQAMWMGLEDIGRVGVEAAVRRALRECEFMPVVATLRELSGHTDHLASARPELRLLPYEQGTSAETRGWPRKDERAMAMRREREAQPQELSELLEEKMAGK